MSCKLACKVAIQLLYPDSTLPAKAHDNDACFDVVANSMVIKDGFVQYNLGFATSIPDGWEAKVYPRSSISKYDLAMCNPPATIDAGYRGEWAVRFKIIPRTIDGFQGPLAIFERAPRIYEVGDKIGQISFQRVPQVVFDLVDTLDASVRREGGFGSTGR